MAIDPEQISSAELFNYMSPNEPVTREELHFLFDSVKAGEEALKSLPPDREQLTSKQADIFAKLLELAETGELTIHADTPGLDDEGDTAALHGNPHIRGGGSLHLV